MSRFKAAIPVDPKGYQWVEQPLTGNYFLGERQIQPGPRMIIVGCSRGAWLEESFGKGVMMPVKQDVYDVFETEPALFRIFASLEPTPEAILRFANEYGEIATPGPLGTINSLVRWEDEIVRMRGKVETADKYIASRFANRTAGTKAALELVNEMLEEVKLSPVAALRGGSIAVHLVCDELLLALNLQLAESILDQKRYRSCELCGKAFELSPQVNRSDRTFCSDTCRVKTYQQRKRRALKMREEGKSLREIVSEIGSDMQTVKGWLKGGNQK